MYVKYVEKTEIDKNHVVECIGKAKKNTPGNVKKYF